MPQLLPLKQYPFTLSVFTEDIMTRNIINILINEAFIDHCPQEEEMIVFVNDTDSAKNEKKRRCS